MKGYFRRRYRTDSHIRAEPSRWDGAKFDDSTGQIYLETTANVPKSDHSHWTWADREYAEYATGLPASRKGSEAHRRYLFNLELPNRIKGLKGAKRLQDMAYECVLDNISDVTLEGVECLPISIVKRLWRAIVFKRCLISFDTWRIFSKVLKQDADTFGLIRYHQEIESPSSRLDIYTVPLTSPSFEFITSLSINTCPKVQDLMKLTTVTNLGVLEITNTKGNEYIAVSDHLMRSWHWAAASNGAWPVLRILRLLNHESLTKRSLAYLSNFQALALYDVRGCRIDASAQLEAQQIGWRATVEPDILVHLDEACEKRARLLGAKLGVQTPDSDYLFANRHLSWLLMDRSEVKWISRGNVAACVAGRESLTDVKGAENSRARESEEKLATQISKSREERRDYMDKFGWDLVSYKSFARIGELRKDTDLVRAGLVVGDQAVVGHEVINSIPMVSLRLGKQIWEDSISTGIGNNHSLGYDWRATPPVATSALRGVTFIRIKVATQNVASTRANTSSHKDTIRDRSGTEAELAKPALSKREAPGVFKVKKKRKLDDILNSFS